MAQCGMCGREDTLKKANVEGTILNVCMNCMKYGTTVKTPKEQRLFKRRTSQREEITDAVVLNAAQLVKQAREKKNTKQIELAKEIAEKESIIQKIESGSFHPSLSLAKKLERALHIKLIEKVKEVQIEKKDDKPAGAFTIADLLKKK